MSTIATKPPFSRPFAVSELRDTGHEIALTATPDECAALARIDGVIAIADLQADFRVQRRGRLQLVVTGHVAAKVTQTCVVSLDPFVTAIGATIEVRYEQPHSHKNTPNPETFAAEPEADPPDPIIDGKIDLGALAAEFLALSLDPYPRKPGAAFAEQTIEILPEKVSPFASLKEKLDQKGTKK